jgi:fumarylacetoacetase
VVLSGTRITRPNGQSKLAEEQAPTFGPSRRLDYETELGFVVGPGNGLGKVIPIEKAESHIFGVVLLNDWSARDIQAWEYQPLGPFLAKSFATTVSPWIVTLEALEPFRCPAFARPQGDPRPLPYLRDAASERSGGVDIILEMYLRSAAMDYRVRLSRGNARDAYWTAAQMIAHHTSNGCNLRPGDLLGSGTLSGPTPDSAGSMMELTVAGKQPLVLPTGETRSFLKDGDEVTERGRCVRPGAVSIGFGEATGTIARARS